MTQITMLGLAGVRRRISMTQQVMADRFFVFDFAAKAGIQGIRGPVLL